MNAMSRMGLVMAFVLVGLGVAVFAKALATVGVDRLVLGHIVGPGLVLAGVLRIRLQRMLTKGGPSGRAS